jgi:hypothetical protein
MKDNIGPPKKWWFMFMVENGECRVGDKEKRSRGRCRNISY